MPELTTKETAAALALCVEALEAVEWLEDHQAMVFDYCPWCKKYHDWMLAGDPKHADDCKREVALAAAKGE